MIYQFRTLLLKYWLWIIYFAMLLAMYWANTLHTNFPDEFDNIVGGWYINKGILPYIGFFTHHNPGAYYIASLITLFTKQSFVSFRLVWSGVLFITLISTYYVLRLCVGVKETKFYLIYMFLLGVSATYFWAQMLLSETVVGYMMVPAYLIIILKQLTKKTLNLKDFILFSITTSIALLTSFTFIFAVAILLLLAVSIYISENGIKWKKLFRIFVLLAIPYLLFIFYLLITGSLAEYYFQAIIYNKDYYIYNFPLVGGTVSTHPARYAISIFYNTSRQFYYLLLQFRDFNFTFPVNVTLFIANASLIVYLLIQRRFILAAAIYTIFVFLNARSSPLDSKETDFHSTVYFMMSLANLSLLTVYLPKSLVEFAVDYKKLLLKAIFIIFSIYSVYLIVFFAHNFSEKTYTKFMGQAPTIYDRPVAAPIINKIVSKNDYFWIGPFELQELLYINGKIPSKYNWFLPANERSEKIRTEIITDLTKNKPKLIVFKDYLTYFGTDPKKYNYPIVNFLKANYFRLSDLKSEGINYKPTLTNLHNFDIDTDFYFDKNRRQEILDQLIASKIIEPAD